MSEVPKLPRLQTSVVLSKEKRQKLDAVLKPITLTDEILVKIMAAFREQMQLASSTDENVRKKSDHLMMNTFIRELLDGTEQGDYLGLDLGGTNFRVVLVRFKDGEAETITNYYNLTDECLSGPAAGVFDFIAESIQDFLQRQGLANSEKKIPLGFTFSFPSTQLALNKQILLTWTKTFKCPDGRGEDPVAMLEAAIERKTKNLPVDVVVVMSDTVSTLMAGNYLDKKCRVGLILGTGCNAAFVENISDIEKWTGDDKDPRHVIVNVELGATGDGGCLDFCRSEYEKEVDKYSNHPGSFTSLKILLDHESGHFNLQPMHETVEEKYKLVSLLEKVLGCDDVSAEDITEWMAVDELDEVTDNDFVVMVTQGEVIEEAEEQASFTLFEKSFAGMYLGELVRLVLVRLIEDGVLFGGEGGKLLDARWKFTTTHVTNIESDVGDSTTYTREVLKQFGLDTVATDEDIAIVREVSEFISLRGAYIVAAVMSVLVNYVRLPEVTIGIDGSLYEKHPKFHDAMMEIFEKYSPGTKVKLILAKDGSGQGAAFAAVSALRQAAKGIRCS